MKVKLPKIKLKKFRQETDFVTTTSEINELGWVKESKNATKLFLDAKEDFQNLCLSNSV